MSANGLATAWDDSCQHAFDKVKGILVNAPLLAFPQDIGEYILDTDASYFAIEGVLNQVIGGEERVICFWHLVV